MTVRAFSHERCARRVCCSSWSCEPHRATCAMVTPHYRQVDELRLERRHGEPVVRLPEAPAS